MGDKLEKTILLVLVLCFSSLIGMTLAQSDEVAGSSNLTILKQDTGSNFTMYTASSDWGIDSFVVGEAVKFNAPKPDWKLMQIRVLGWNGFNETTRTVPAPSDFLIEVRDDKLNLLYRLADTQNAYFTISSPEFRGIDIPALPLTGDFYIIFYDRSTMSIGMELENGTGNSYFYTSTTGELMPAVFTIENQSTNINWIIRAVGE